MTKKILVLLVAMLALTVFVENAIANDSPSSNASKAAFIAAVRESVQHLPTHRVEPYSTEIHEIQCRAGKLAKVSILGDGDTDLDLYIYDMNGNLITSNASFDDYTKDYCSCSWTPNWTGTFVIKVKNWGSVYNRYRIWTD